MANSTAKKRRRPLHSPIPRKEVLQRINRLEGQIKALGRTVEEGDDWLKIFNLVMSIEGSADQVIADLFQRYLESTMEGRMMTDEEKQKHIEIRRIVNMVLRRF